MKYTELEQIICKNKRTNKDTHTESYLYFLDSIRFVADYLEEDQITVIRKAYANSRVREYSTVRSMLICLMLKRGFGVKQIGRILNRDHTTIIHYRDALVLNPFNRDLKDFIKKLV
jgi:chromosomal replication initiation ATPase DnaA